MRIFPQSIRWRIQLWYLLLLAVIIASLLVAFHRNQREIKYQVIDRELASPLPRLLPRFGGRPAPRPRSRRFPVPDQADEFGGAPEEWEGDEFREGQRRRGRRDDPPEYVKAVIDDAVSELREKEIFVVHWDRDGEVRYASENAPNESRPLPDDVPQGRERLIKRTADGYREFIHANPDGSFFLLGTSIEPLESELSALKVRLIGIGIAIVGGGFLVGWLLIGRSLKPIEVIGDTAQRIAEGDLSERIEIRESGSELGQLSKVLNKTFGRLETAFEHQIRFTADASHEMRTPIAVILAKSQFALSRDRSPEKYQEALQTCLESAQHMRMLTDGLLELSKVDSGEFHLRREKGNLEDLTREVVRMIEPLADERGLEIRCELESVSVEFDLQKMRQALLNLLSNAVKYSGEEGNIVVTLGEANGEIRWSVKDSGAGMNAETLKHVFERFFRVDRARTRNGRNGTGLGLPITKAIVEAHGGRVEVESEPDVGTTFYVILPRVSK